MTDTDTTTQAAPLTNQDDPMATVLGSIKTDAEVAADAAKAKAAAEAGTAKTAVTGDVAKLEGTVETDIDAAKAKVETDVETIETDVDAKVDAAKLWFDKSQTTAGTEATTLQADTLTDIQKAKMAAMDTFTHISNANNSGIISDELTKAKRLLTVIVGYIEAHL